MRTLPRRLPLLVLQAVALLAMISAASFVAAHLGLSSDHAHAIAAAPLMLNGLKGFGRTYDDLKNLMKPADADEPESVPAVLYDRQPYAAAGAATLTFFANATQANASDLTLSNFSSGLLEGGFYFELHRLFCWFDSIPASAASNAVAGPGNDVEILHKTARGIVSLTMKGKTYGPLPLFFTGRPGGPTSYIQMFGTAAAENVQTGNNENNGGFPYLGNVIIPPVTQFKAVMNFNSTAISALTNIGLGMMGILHRPVA